MTTPRNPGAEPPGAPENQADRQRLFEEWVTALRRKGQNGVKPPVPLAVEEAIRSSAPPPPAADDGKTQVYRVPADDAQKAAHEKAERERAEAAALAALDIAQTQVYRIPEKVVTRAKALEKAQRTSTARPAPQRELEAAAAPEKNPDAIPTDRPPNIPADDHTAVFVPPPDLLARAQRHLEALAAEEALRAAAGETTGTGEPADLSLVEALAAVEAQENMLPDAARLSTEEQPRVALSTAKTEAPKAPEVAPVASFAPGDANADDSLSNEIASLRPRYAGYIGWTSVALLVVGVAYAIMTTVR